MSEEIKKVIMEKIKMFREQAAKLNKEIGELDMLMNMKRSDFLRLDGAIQALQGTLNDLKEEKIEEEVM